MVRRSRFFPAALLLSAALALPGCASRPPLHAGTLVDPAALAARAARGEELMARRFLSPEGMVIYAQSRVRPPDLRRGPYGDLSDTACWTGYYAGAEALRLAATGDAAARRRLDRALAGLEFLARVTGVPGLLARSADRNLAVPERARRGGIWRPGAVPGTVYRGDVSKDQVAGVLFGLGCVLARVEDPDLRNRAGRLAAEIASRLEADGLALRDRDGKVTKHGDLSPRYLGIPLAVNAAIVLAAFRLSAAGGGPAAHARRYRELVDRGWARAASFAKVRVLGKTNRNNDHMATACLYPLALLERDPAVRELYVRGLLRVAAGVRGEGNSLFLGYAMAVAGPREDLLLEAWGSLARLPVVKESRPVDLRGRVRGVVPMEMRPYTVFIWRSDPYVLRWGPRGRKEPKRYAPVDYLAAYWLLRAHDLLPPGPVRLPS